MDTVGEQSVNTGMQGIGNLYEGREADLGRCNFRMGDMLAGKPYHFSQLFL